MVPRYVSVFLCFFVGGVAIDSVYFISPIVLMMGMVISAALSAALALWNRSVGVILFCMILGLGCGLWYINRTFGENEYGSFIGQYIETEGTITTDPITQDRNQQVTFAPDGYNQYVRAQLYTAIPDAKKGDRIWIRGQLELPENFSDFDYIGYLQRWNVYAVLKKPRLIVIQRAPTNWRTGLLAVREYVVRRSKVFPKAEGSLIVGMLIGQRQNIPEDVSKAFKVTGLTHIVAVSGFNMTIIATACGALVWYLGRRNTNILTLIIVAGFVVITGASAAVVRAGIMATLMVGAQLLGRQYGSLYSLLLVAGVMVVLNPRIVVWDVGFQLSVAATFGVLIAFRIKKSDDNPNFLSEVMRPTMGAIAFTAPIIAYHFQTLSLIAPIANLIVLPFVSWIMLLGALSLLPLVGSVFAFPSELITSGVLGIATQLSRVPYASIDIHVPLFWLGMYYGAAALYCNIRSKMLRLKK